VPDPGSPPCRERAALRELEVTAEVYVLGLGKGEYLVYAPLRRTAFLAGTRLVRTLRAIQSHALTPAMDPAGEHLAFFRELGIVDGSPERAPMPDAYPDPEPTELTLLLTTACNLRCSYCYASTGETRAEQMSLETARSGIDYVSRNALRRGAGTFSISYHGGGEPTRNFAVLGGSLAYAHEVARRGGLECRSSICTNGVLPDDQIDWIVSHVSGATVSFDGLPEVHDRHRLKISGEGSSGEVMRTLRRFDQASYSFGVRITTVAGDIARLPDSVEFILSSFHPRAILVEPVYLLGRGSRQESAETAEFIAAFRAAQAVARAHGHRLRFSAVRPEVLTSHFCQATQGNFCLAPSGRVTSCYEVFSEDRPYAEKFFYGAAGAAPGEYVFDRAVLAGLRAQAVENREFCRDCFCRWTCAGDCYHKCLAFHGGEEPLGGSGRCNVIRELTKDELLGNIAAAGGLVWRGQEVNGCDRLC